VGTGAAGIGGSMTYLIMTTLLQLSLPVTLTFVSLLSPIMGLSYFFLMSKPHLLAENKRVLSLQYATVSGSLDEHATLVADVSNESLESSPPGAVDSTRAEFLNWRDRIIVLKPLFMRYMLPLFFVFWAGTACRAECQCCCIWLKRGWF
jgi:hypothetical protein